MRPKKRSIDDIEYQINQFAHAHERLPYLITIVLCVFVWLLILALLVYRVRECYVKGA